MDCKIEGLPSEHVSNRIGLPVLNTLEALYFSVCTVLFLFHLLVEENIFVFFSVRYKIIPRTPQERISPMPTVNIKYQ